MFLFKNGFFQFKIKLFKFTRLLVNNGLFYKDSNWNYKTFSQFNLKLLNNEWLCWTITTNLTNCWYELLLKLLIDRHLGYFHILDFWDYWMLSEATLVSIPRLENIWLKTAETSYFSNLQMTAILDFSWFRIFLSTINFTTDLNKNCPA